VANIGSIWDFVSWANILAVELLMIHSGHPDSQSETISRFLPKYVKKKLCTDILYAQNLEFLWQVQ
jgi:hypothetical protein